MAIKRNFQLGTRYYYAKLKRTEYAKDHKVGLHVLVLERDAADPTISLLVSSMFFECKTEDELTYFSIEALSEINTNIIQQGYLYLKNKVDLFRDFEDC